MDRNTLTAFFLISLVLIFTPKYIELISGKKNSGENERLLKDPLLDTSKTFINPSPKSVFSNLSDNFVFDDENQKKETTTIVKNMLFSAELTSKNGGSFISFQLMDYFDKDSLPVDLINRGTQTLTNEIKTLDGSYLDLSSPWVLQTKLIPEIIEDSLKLIYTKKLFGRYFISKSLTFYSDSYQILCEIDASEIPKDLIEDNLIISWFGGLKPTEKNIADDQLYFQVYSFLGGEKEKFKVKEEKQETAIYNGALDWGAIRTKYFSIAFLPKNPNSIRKTTISGAKGKDGEVYNFSMFSNTSEKAVFNIYLGPLEYERIKKVERDFEEIMDFGWSPIRPISKAVLFTLTKMHEYIPNYGYILVLFSLLIKIIVFPLTRKAYQSTTAMQKIQPELLAIREKYKNNPQKLNQAQMKIYKKRGVNPLGGCLPMLIQMPLLYSLFVVFRTTIELRSEPFIFWIKDLSAPDYVFDLPFHIPIYGSQVAILPIFMVLSMFVQQKMMTGGSIQQPQQKTMQYIMIPVFFLIFNGFPSGLNLYYTLFNILTIFQQKFITDKT